MELIFATNNAHKLEEIRLILKDKAEIKSLKDIGFNEEIPETNPTIKQNAHQKAKYIYDRYNINVIADDTGLEIEALGGEPGVYSARYAGVGCRFEDNVIKVLANMKDIANRKARFITVICLIWQGNVHYFEGIVDGIITTKKSGNGGFGYDPIFQPDGYLKTYSEMTAEQKNKISHRALATQQMLAFFK